MQNHRIEPDRLVKIIDEQSPWYGEIALVIKQENGVYWTIELLGKQTLFPSYLLVVIDD